MGRCRVVARSEVDVRREMGDRAGEAFEWIRRAVAAARDRSPACGGMDGRADV